MRNIRDSLISNKSINDNNNKGKVGDVLDPNIRPPLLRLNPDDDDDDDDGSGGIKLLQNDRQLVEEEDDDDKGVSTTCTGTVLESTRGDEVGNLRVTC